MSAVESRPGTADVFGPAMAGLSGALVGPLPLAGELPVARWHGMADLGDQALLAHCLDPTIDLGCGPGRLAQQLARNGVRVLGVDVSAVAVAQARARGVRSVRADVLGPLPDTGRWRCVLLADGNIGIGGDPARLLRRARRLLTPDGRVVVELARPGVALSTGVVRLRTPRGVSEPFPWAVVGPGAVRRVAAAAGLQVAGVHHVHGRWFAVLSRPFAVITREGERRWPRG